jgi:hypothetical protein
MVTKSNEQRQGLGAALWSVAVVGLLFAVAAPSFLGSGSRSSVAIGAALALVNLWVVARTVRGFLYPEGPRSPWISLAMLKFAVLFLGVTFLVRGGYAKILPLIVGYGALPVGIVVSQLKSASVAPEEG